MCTSFMNGPTTFLVEQGEGGGEAPTATDRYYLKHRNFLHVITRAITNIDKRTNRCSTDTVQSDSS